MRDALHSDISARIGALEWNAFSPALADAHLEAAAYVSFGPTSAVQHCTMPPVCRPFNLDADVALENAAGVMAAPTTQAGSCVPTFPPTCMHRVDDDAVLESAAAMIASPTTPASPCIPTLPPTCLHRVDDDAILESAAGLSLQPTNDPRGMSTCVAAYCGGPFADPTDLNGEFPCANN